MHRAWTPEQEARLDVAFQRIESYSIGDWAGEMDRIVGAQVDGRVVFPYDGEPFRGHGVLLLDQPGLTLMDWRVKAGGVFEPRHWHRVREILTVTCGEVEYPDLDKRCGVGDTVVVEPGAPHMFRAVTDCRFTLAWSPGLKVVVK